MKPSVTMEQYISFISSQLNILVHHHTFVVLTEHIFIFAASAAYLVTITLTLATHWMGLKGQLMFACLHEVQTRHV